MGERRKRGEILPVNRRFDRRNPVRQFGDERLDRFDEVGVYGMLGIGLMLFCFKGMNARQVWRTGILRYACWSINIGLALMVLISVLPVGLMQTWASVEHGMWYARSAEFLQTDLVGTLRWLRVIGDTIFATGIVALAWFVLGLVRGWSIEEEAGPVAETSRA